MTFNSVLLATEGFSASFMQAQLHREEDSVGAGENIYLRVIAQLAQLNISLGFCEKALKAAQRAPLSSVFTTATYLSPILLGYVKSQELAPEVLRPAIVFMHKNIGNLCELATLVSIVSLVFFGASALAYSALFGWGLGVVDRHHWISPGARKILHTYASPVITASSLITGGFVIRLFAVLSLLSMWYMRTSKERKDLYGPPLAQGTLTPEIMESFFAHTCRLQIAKPHLGEKAFPPVPDIDIVVSLRSSFDRIARTAANAKLIRNKLEQDARFQERYREPLTDAQIFDIARMQLVDGYAKPIRDRQIKEGEPTGYETLQSYVKIIAKYVEDHAGEVFAEDILIRLAVEGGEYCGPGKYEAAEDVYKQIAGEDLQMPLREKVLHYLQNERGNWFRSLYAQLFEQDPLLKQMERVIDSRDVHNYNLIVNLYGERLGLRKAAADSDEKAAIDAWAQLFFSLTFGKEFEALLWRKYTPEEIADKMSKQIGTASLPKPDIYAFWRTWIERQSEKKLLLEELETGRLYGYPLEEQGKINPLFIQLMLLDMGIAEVVQ